MSRNTTKEPEVVIHFKSWLVENGATIHPDIHFQTVSLGYTIIAIEAIPADISIVSIPFSLAITPAVARGALESVLKKGNSSVLKEWSERQLICSYICMHLILDELSFPTVLKHRPYINTLPSPEKLLTSLHFTPNELELFKGSNLYGATIDRRKAWESEWSSCQSIIALTNPTWGDQFTWERYLTASTYLSSRAFPSTLLSTTPSLVPTPESHPVLLPGIDALNHARAQPVSWMVTHPSPLSSFPTSTDNSSHSMISLVLRTPTPTGSELFNNYGPKPNAELILGYGFSLPYNPDDTIVLKIGGMTDREQSQGKDRRWEVGRNAKGIEPIWKAVLDVVRQQDRDDDEDQEEGESGHWGRGEELGEEGVSVEDEMCAADLLMDMAEGLLSRLPSGMVDEAQKDEVRHDVVEMLGNYIEGQRDVLQSIMQFAREKETRAVEKAQEQGLDIVEEGDEEEE